MEPVEKRLETIERLLRDLLKEAKVPKETWVKASVIMEVTGWNAEKMRWARKNNYVKIKRGKNDSIWYSVESIPQMFIKKQTA